MAKFGEQVNLLSPTTEQHLDIRFGRRWACWPQNTSGVLKNYLNEAEVLACAVQLYYARLLENVVQACSSAA